MSVILPSWGVVTTPRRGKDFLPHPKEKKG